MMMALEAMPERELLREFDSLRLSFYIFQRNHAELRQFLDFYISDSSNQRLYDMAVKERVRTLGYEIARLLQNFVAAAKSLVDHTRNMYRRLYKKGEFPDYDREVKSVFAEDPLIRFVQDLRNFLLHYRTAAIQFTYTVDPRTEEATNSLAMTTEELKRFEGWSPQARKFLDAAGDKVDLSEVVEQYNAKVEDFYRWLGQKQHDIHREEIDRFAAKEAELFLLQIEDSLDRWLSNPNPKENQAPGDRGLFLSIFDISEFDTLERLPEGSLARADMTVAMLAGRFPIPPRIEKKIRRAYTDPAFFQRDVWLSEHRPREADSGELPD